MNWVFDRSTRVHSTDGCKVVATVRKDGDTYAWRCPGFDDRPAISGLRPNLKEAKEAVENWINKPEPETYICVICGEPIVTRVEWSGPRYTSWARHVPGAVELKIVFGQLFNVGYRCAACCTQARADKEHANDG